MSLSSQFKPSAMSSKVCQVGCRFFRCCYIAVWNCAYPDQQCDYLKGDEWITLANFCASDTLACKTDGQGNHILRLYLPENQLVVFASYADGRVLEVPLHIDILVIRPDDGRINIVWRAILDKANNSLDNAMLIMLDRQDKDEMIATYFSQKGTIARP